MSDEDEDRAIGKLAKQERDSKAASKHALERQLNELAEETNTRQETKSEICQNGGKQDEIKREQDQEDKVKGEMNELQDGITKADSHHQRRQQMTDEQRAKLGNEECQIGGKNTQQLNKEHRRHAPHNRQQQQNNKPQSSGSSSEHEQIPISADYLAQLIKDKKQLASMTAVSSAATTCGQQQQQQVYFHHLPRLLDEEISKVRQQLFQLQDVVSGLNGPLVLPEPEGELVQLQEKIYVPNDEHPEYNFVGRILGPRGMTAKQLEQETGCKIMIRGRGSMRDKKKEEQNRGKQNWEHLNDDLHVLITIEDTQNRAQLKLDRAIEEVRQLLVPIVDGEDELKKRQLMELAIINGTYRDCTHNEALNKMLNEAAVYATGQQQQQQSQPQSQQQVPNVGGPSHSAGGHQQVQHLQLAPSSPVPNGLHHHAQNHTAHNYHQASNALRQFYAGQIPASSSSHSLPNGSSGVPSTGSNTPNSVHGSGGGPKSSSESTQAPMAATIAPMHLQQQQQPASSSAAAAAAAAVAAFMASPDQSTAPPSGVMYAHHHPMQSYHEFQHYAAMAAAAAVVQQQQQQQQQSQQQPMTASDAYQAHHQAAIAAAAAAAAAAASNHHHPHLSQAHHLVHHPHLPLHHHHHLPPPHLPPNHINHNYQQLQQYSHLIHHQQQQQHLQATGNESPPIIGAQAQLSGNNTNEQQQQLNGNEHEHGLAEQTTSLGE